MKIWERGREIEEAVAFKRKEDIPSGPEAVLGGRLEMRERMVSSVQRSDSGQKGDNKGGKGSRGGAFELKQEVKNELRHSAFSLSEENRRFSC